jgi:16S rRNA (guanine527-N7)-methyltransferase
MTAPSDVPTDDDVSRETLARELALAIACERGHEAAARLEQYAEILATDGIDHGMIGPREVPRLWDRHLLNCVQVVSRLPESASVADVGTGAGLPGLVWAIARPDLRVTLIEPLLRRTRFLESCVSQLELSNVVILRARAQETDQQFDLVTSRAVATATKLVKWCLPLVAPGGSFVALKGRSAQKELDEARPWLARAGVRDTMVRTYGSGDSASTTIEFTVSRETP